jgi:hypothetical protein
MTKNITDKIKELSQHKSFMLRKLFLWQFIFPKHSCKVVLYVIFNKKSLNVEGILISLSLILSWPKTHRNNSFWISKIEKTKWCYPAKAISNWYINVNKGVFLLLIISYLWIKSYNVLNHNNCSTDWSFPLT